MKLAFEEQTKSTLDQLLEEEHESLTLVTNHEEANYVIEQIKKLQLQKEDVEVETTRYINQAKDKANMFKEQQLNSLDYQIDRYKTMLEPYVLKQLEESGKKSVKFIEGTAGFRKQDELIEHDDELLEKEVKGIKDNEYFKTTVKFNWSAVKKDLTFKDGKAYLNDKELSSVNYEEHDDAFYVK